MLLATLQLLGALGEEVGWRGFLQPALETPFGRLGAAVIVGLVWSVWHVDRLTDPVIFAGFALTSVALSVALAYLTGGARWQRALIAGLVHAVVNLVLVLGMDPEAFSQAGDEVVFPVAVPQLALGLGVVVAA